MAIDWKTIISEFDGKPTLLQAIGKLRKAVEEETITIQQAQAEIAKLEAQQKTDEALIITTQTTANNALDLAKTNEKDIGTLDGQVAVLETDKLDKVTLGDPNFIKLYGVNNNGTQQTFSCSETKALGYYIPRRAINKGLIAGIDPAETLDNDSFAIYSAPVYWVRNLIKSVLNNQKFKTLFGNQSIVGNGNIDLYYHYVAVTITNVRYPLHIDFYSSKSLKCDSLTDLKTLLGDTFERALFGSATTGAAGAFYGNFLSNSGAHGIIVGSSTVSAKYYEWTDITINDTVTTI